MNTRVNPLAFDPSARVKLARILAMTSSPFDNEALVAMRKANSFLASLGKTWTDALCGHSPAATPRKPRAKKTPKEPRTWLDLCRVVAVDPLAEPWERKFCADMAANFRGVPFTHRQAATLKEILQRRRERAKRAA